MGTDGHFGVGDVPGSTAYPNAPAAPQRLSVWAAGSIRSNNPGKASLNDVSQPRARLRSHGGRPRCPVTRPWQPVIVFARVLFVVARHWEPGTWSSVSAATCRGLVGSQAEVVVAYCLTTAACFDAEVACVAIVALNDTSQSSIGRPFPWPIPLGSPLAGPPVASCSRAGVVCS